MTGAAEKRVYLASNGKTLLCRGCNQKAISENDSYHDICMKRVAPLAWNASQRHRFIQRVRRIPEVRKAYRQIKNGHRGGPVARKPAHRGRRHAW